VRSAAWVSDVRKEGAAGFSDRAIFCDDFARSWLYIRGQRAGRVEAPIVFRLAVVARWRMQLLFRQVTSLWQKASALDTHDAFLGTFFPFFRAMDNPIAMACLRLFTLPALPPLPLRAVPRL
jgi:hypothetical protein